MSSGRFIPVSIEQIKYPGDGVRGYYGLMGNFRWKDQPCRAIVEFDPVKGRTQGEVIIFADDSNRYHREVSIPVLVTAQGLLEIIEHFINDELQL